MHNVKIIIFLLSVLGSTFINANPLPFTIGQDTTICLGDTILLTPSITADTLSYLWSTGDTTENLQVFNQGIYHLTISSQNCSSSDSIVINIAPIPSIDIQVTNPCFGDSAIFNNNSQSFQAIDWEWNFDDGSNIQNINDPTFSYLFPENGATYIVGIIATDSFNCTTNDSIVLENKLSPSPFFTIDSVCVDAIATILNQSTNISANSNFHIDYGDGNIATLSNNTQFDYSYSIDGGFDLNVLVDNNNGCLDSFQLSTTIYPKTPVFFEGLRNSYCQNELGDTLFSSNVGGFFFGENVIENFGLNDSIAFFNPTNPGTNQLVYYEFTNSNSCVSSDSFTVENVFADPMLEFVGIDDSYCIDDPIDTIFINVMGGIFSGPDITDIDPNDNFVTFEINAPGPSSIAYSFTTQDGCSYELNENLLVNDLPELNLGVDTSIVSGEIISIGFSGTPTPNLSFLWATGETTPLIEVSNPGFYLLTINDNLTTCTFQDTILVEFTTAIKTNELDDFKIFPNPVNDIIRSNILDFCLTYDCKIFDQCGKLMISKVSSNSKLIDASKLAKGFYYIQFITKERSFTEKIIKN